MSSVTGEELELKLELTPSELQRITTDPGLEPLTVGKPETHTLRSIYYTAECGQKISVRAPETQSI